MYQKQKRITDRNILDNFDTLSDVPLLATTVMRHNDAQRIALLTKLFCMSKVATFSGRF